MYLQKINLKNKYALVTGAGKGLGRACSIALAEAGATSLDAQKKHYTIHCAFGAPSPLFRQGIRGMCIYIYIGKY